MINPARPRFWCPGAPCTPATLMTGVNQRRGYRWADARPVYNQVNQIYPPNGPLKIAQGGDGNTAIVPPSSRHQGGVHVLMGDGAVKFVTDSIEAGNRRAPMVYNGQTFAGSVPGSQSIRGLWGALGTRASSETISAF